MVALVAMATGALASCGGDGKTFPSREWNKSGNNKVVMNDMTM